MKIRISLFLKKTTNLSAMIDGLMADIATEI